MSNEKVLASVMGKVITQADVEEFIDNLGQRGENYRNPQGYAIILDELINQKLLLLDAARNFYEAAKQYGSEEYSELTRIMRENPTMSVSIRTITRTKTNNANKGK